MAEAPLHRLPGPRVLVVGTGVSATAAREVLEAVGADVVVVDDDRADAPAALLDGVDLVVPSPGVPEHSPLVVAAEEAGTPVWSEPELGWVLHPRTTVGVTGTNGKTTVTEMVAAMLAAGGVDAVACGNIGHPYARAAAAAAEDAVLVAELSSFQLRHVHALRPTVAVLTNLAPDHLDWHGSLRAYGMAKARIWRAQRDDDAVVAAVEDGVVADLLLQAPPPARLLPVRSGTRPDGSADGAVVRPGGIALHVGASAVALTTDELPLAAPHHLANLVMAGLAALRLGAPAAAVAEVARTFRPGSHRLELVVEQHGVRWIDDSKATNAHAAAAALRSHDDVVWIAGGLAKGVDLSVLAPELGVVRHALLIGSAAPELLEVCRRAGVPADDVGDLATAVARATELAGPGTTVLLAPACASFDQFSGYAERGERFATLARAAATSDRTATPNGDRTAP